MVATVVFTEVSTVFLMSQLNADYHGTVVNPQIGTMQPSFPSMDDDGPGIAWSPFFLTFPGLDNKSA
jgi:hypothetical protein